MNKSLDFDDSKILEKQIMHQGIKNPKFPGIRFLWTCKFCGGNELTPAGRKTHKCKIEVKKERQKADHGKADKKNSNVIDEIVKTFSENIIKVVSVTELSSAWDDFKVKLLKYESNPGYKSALELAKNVKNSRLKSLK